MADRLAYASFKPLKAKGTDAVGTPLLAGAARTVLGWSKSAPVIPVAPAADTMFGPRGVCLHPDGSFWVSDTGHHRMLGWRRRPEQDGTAADILVGQLDFGREGRNAKGTPGPTTLNVPAGLCAWGEGIAIADSWNHRVLLWRRTPSHHNQRPDFMLGQADFAGNLPNRGAPQPDASALYWPSGVAEIDGRLLVADAGNRRVLIFDRPRADGAAATIILGQPDPTTRDENAGAAVSAMGMRWPHAIASWSGHLAVADAGNNRVMLWRGMPERGFVPCDAVLGQSDPTGCDHNRAGYYPSASALNMPYGLAVAGSHLVVADTANSRLLGFADSDRPDAERLAGQPDFASKGDNRWGLAGRDTLCWPYGIAAADGLLAIADSGNNRVMLWDLA